MVLLRRVIGDALRARRQGQHRTLREVSTAANVSLGYLSEIERGQKEASSELLAAICEALGARLSELLGEVSGTLALAEGMEGVLVPGRGSGPRSAAPSGHPVSRPSPGPPGHHRRQGLRLGPPGHAAQGHPARHPQARARRRLRRLILRRPDHCASAVIGGGCRRRRNAHAARSLDAGDPPG